MYPQQLRCLRSRMNGGLIVFLIYWGKQFPSRKTHAAPSWRKCTPGEAGGRSGLLPWNPRHIPEEMNAGVACGGAKSLPATVSVSSGLSLIRLFTEEFPSPPHTLMSVPVPQALACVPPCSLSLGPTHWPPSIFAKSLFLLLFVFSSTHTYMCCPILNFLYSPLVFFLLNISNDFNKVYLYYMPTRHADEFL